MGATDEQVSRDQGPRDPGRQQVIAEFEKLAVRRLAIEVLYRSGLALIAVSVVGGLLSVLFPDTVTMTLSGSSIPGLLLIVSVLPLRRIRKKVRRQYEEARRRLEG